MSNAELGVFRGRDGGQVYHVDLVPLADGPVTVGVAEGVAHDPNGNGNAAAGMFSVVFDGTGPALSSVAPAVTSSGNRHRLPLAFTEPVTGLEISDFDLVNVVMDQLTGADGSHELQITTTATPYSVSLRENAVTDMAGNGNAAVTVWEGMSETFDGPKPVISGLPEFFLPGDRLSITINFGTPVTGFASDDILVTNGEASYLAGGPSVYTDPPHLIGPV